VLDGDQVVYVAQVPSRHSMRMFTEVGRRVDAHTTAVGRAVLAELPPDRLRSAVLGSVLFQRELGMIRERGYAEDDEETEIGVRCIAVTVPGAPGGAAISISGPATRMSRIDVDEVVPLMHRVAAQLAQELTVDRR
jgi:IclR family acetate operon transcriptional repressor